MKRLVDKFNRGVYGNLETLNRMYKAAVRQMEEIIDSSSKDKRMMKKTKQQQVCTLHHNRQVICDKFTYLRSSNHNNKTKNHFQNSERLINQNNH